MDGACDVEWQRINATAFWPGGLALLAISALGHFRLHLMQDPDQLDEELLMRLKAESVICRYLPGNS